MRRARSHGDARTHHANTGQCRSVAIDAAARGNQVVETYRLDIRLERGGNRMYDVSTPADLRVGDRVRIENGVVSRL